MKPCSLLIQVPPRYQLRNGAMHIEGLVLQGREHAKTMISLDPRPLASRLDRLPCGVYFGWASPSSSALGDTEVQKAVIRISRLPADCSGEHEANEQTTVSVQMFEHDSPRGVSADCGERFRIILLGFVRPEVAEEDLVQGLADVAISCSQLEDPQLIKHREDEFLSQGLVPL